MIAPLVILPFLYVLQNLFSNEISAIMFLLIYQISIQFILPFLLVAMRLNPKSEVLGDNLYRLAKILPLESVMSSIIYNKETLSALNRYRDQNISGVGPPVETDEGH